MTRPAISASCVLGALLLSGCAQPAVTGYVPLGPSTGNHTFQALKNGMARHYVCDGTLEDARITMQDGDALRDTFGWEVDDVLGGRLVDPRFRCLCAFVNTYFCTWTRMIILERFGFVDDGYGYVVVVPTPCGPRAVTNMVAQGGDPWGWEGRVGPRPLRVEKRKLETVLTRLDKAGSILPQALLWFEAVDSPIFVLHDIRADGSHFSFGVRGVGAWREHWCAPDTADGVSQEDAAVLVGKGKPDEVVFFDSTRGKELRAPNIKSFQGTASK